MTLLAFVERFQDAIATILVGVFGFAGVILTLRANAGLAQTERLAATAQDRQAVRVALSAELRIIQTTLLDRIGSFNQRKKSTTSSILVPTSSMTTVYDALIERLGLLPPDEVLVVVNAYLAVQEIPGRLWFLGNDDESLPTYTAISPDKFDTARKLHESALVFVKAAIEALDRDCPSGEAATPGLFRGLIKKLRR